tara:strand:- start:786 stop:938 length:153 start_codon:yes stop_codon:yes gene_type:complete
MQKKGVAFVMSNLGWILLSILGLLVLIMIIKPLREAIIDLLAGGLYRLFF